MSVAAEERVTPLSNEHLDSLADAFNRKDVEAIVEFFAEDGVFRLAHGKNPEGTTLKGKAAIGAFLKERFEAISDMRWENATRFFVGNRAVSEWVVKGTRPNGTTIHANGCDIYTFDDDGKIVIKDTFWKFDPGA
jgi:hypothetical protein